MFTETCFEICTPLLLFTVRIVRALKSTLGKLAGEMREVQGSGFRVQGSEFRVQGSGFRIYGVFAE